MHFLQSFFSIRSFQTVRKAWILFILFSNLVTIVNGIRLFPWNRLFIYDQQWVVDAEASPSPVYGCVSGSLFLSFQGRLFNIFRLIILSADAEYSFIKGGTLPYLALCLPTPIASNSKHGLIAFRFHLRNLNRFLMVRLAARL